MRKGCVSEVAQTAMGRSAHLEAAAFLAIADLFDADSLLARAFPPLALPEVITSPIPQTPLSEIVSICLQNTAFGAKMQADVPYAYIFEYWMTGPQGAQKYCTLFAGKS